MHKASCWLPVLLALTLWRAVTCAAPVPLYSYHESEPFVVKHELGLAPLYVANAPHDAFSRHILMTPELSGLENGIHALVAPLQLDLDELEELPIDSP